MRNYLLILGVGFLFACTGNSTRFELLTPDVTGIDFNNVITESDSFHIMKFEYIYNGGGVGIGDLNNDGLQDLVFAGNMVTSKIYLNQGNMQFEDITENLPGIDNGQWFSGVSIIDINSDGLLDLYMTSTANEDSVKRRNRLWVNQGFESGIPKFEEMAETYRIADEGFSVHSGFFDYDLDGDLDLYVMNNIVNENLPTSYRQKFTDGTADNNDKLYRNNGDNTFSDITIEAGILIEGYGLGLAIGDLNKDGYPDIYVSNDYMANDVLYMNQANGTFKNEISTLLSYQTKSSMGNDMADINNDGLLDIITLDMLPEHYTKKKQTINGNSYVFYLNDEKYGYEHQYLRNMLHVNNGLLDDKLVPFSEVGQMMGVYQTEWSWSPLFADFDNDGDKDLIVTNGYPKDLTDKDWTKYKAEVYGFVASDQHVMNRAPMVKVSNFAFENIEPYSFVDRTESWGMEIPSYSYGAAFVDLDNDGDLDYVVNNLKDAAFIYKNKGVETNPGNSNYIRIKLLGKDGNTLGIGSKVELWANGEYQFQELFLSRGYISSIEPIVHFGLASNAHVDSIKVTWPQNRNISVVYDISSNQLIQLRESESSELSRIETEGKGLKIFQPREDVLDLNHNEGDYIEFFQTQNIIQHKFSQIGPSMASGDIDGDGNEDLVVGASNTEPTQVYLRKDTGFEKVEIAGLTDRKWSPEADLAILDVDMDGDNDIVAVSGGYSNERDSDYKHFLYINEGGTFRKSELPVVPFISTTIRPFDFDHDGDVDLFLGARVKRDAFPLAPNSYILINESGKFRTDSSLSFSLGLVTDALWTDYDNDGWEDLLIAREWNSLTVLKNNEGKSMESASIDGFDDYKGYWYSLAAGDFDMDGDQDYIAGNLGENHRFTINNEYPLRLYPIQLDRNGIIAPFITGYWTNPEGEMTEYPVNYLDELGAQSMFIQNLFKDYTTFSKASADYVLTGWPEERKYFLTMNTSSSYIIWNDKGKMRWERLPDEIQVSPVTEMLVKDLNGDSYPDVLITGNDHSYDVSTGFYDANKGIVMLSEGPEASFKVLQSSESGFLVNGQVGSILLFEGDTTLVVTGINRGKAVVHQLLK